MKKMKHTMKSLAFLLALTMLAICVVILGTVGPCGVPKHTQGVLLGIIGICLLLNADENRLVSKGQRIGVAASADPVSGVAAVHDFTIPTIFQRCRR